MTKDETIKLMQYFEAAYKDFYNGKDVREVVAVWHDALKDENPRIVSEAARNYVKTNEFAPTVAGLMKQINMIRTETMDTELWALISKASKNGNYGAVEEFEKLPPVCQKYLGSPSTLKDFALIGEGRLAMVVRPNFLKYAEAIREHQTVQNGLPMEVRAAIEESKRKLLEGST